MLIISNGLDDNVSDVKYKAPQKGVILEKCLSESPSVHPSSKAAVLLQQSLNI